MHSPAQEATLLPIQETKEELPAQSASVTPAQTPQNGEPADVDAKAGVSEHKESSIGNWAEEVEEAEQDGPKGFISIPGHSTTIANSLGRNQHTFYKYHSRLRPREEWLQITPALLSEEVAPSSYLY